MSETRQLVTPIQRHAARLARPPRFAARHAERTALVDTLMCMDSQFTQPGEDEVWMVSYMDIMTLLLTLFVLLLAYTRITPDLLADTQHARTVVHSMRTAAPAPHAVAHAQVAAPVTTSPQMSAQKPPAAMTPLPLTASPWAWPALSFSHALPLENTPADAAPAIPSSQHAEPATPAAQPATATAPTAQQKLLAALHAGALGDHIEVSTRPDSVNLEISDNILFEPGQAALLPLGQTLLDKLAALLAQQDYSVSVEGHTDNVPIENARFASNWELSTARATNVTRYLIERGIAAARLRAIGYADTQPRAANDTVQGRARNRRVSLVLHTPTAPTHTRGE